MSRTEAILCQQDPNLKVCHYNIYNIQAAILGAKRGGQLAPEVLIT